jgi:hypothetical protein
MQPIRIYLVQERKPGFIGFTVFLFLVEWVTMLFLSRQVEYGTVAFFGAMGACLLNIGLSISYFINRKTKTALRYMMAGFMIFATAWLLIGQIVFALLTVVFAAFGWKEIAPRFLELNEDGLQLNTFPIKKFSWSEVEHIQIKDGLLTIDFKDNRLMQFTLSESLNPTLQESAIFEFRKLLSTTTEANS